VSVPERLEPDRTGTLAGVGDIEIWWQAWLATDSRANVVLAHGAGEHSSRYGHVAKALRERGYSVWALDHRGHGHSKGSRALIDRIENATTDMRSFVDLVTTEAGGKKPFLLGHSMGGLLSLAYTLRHEETLHALALSAPLASLGAASTSDRVASAILTRIAPKLGVVQVDPSGVSRDPEVVRDYETDPLVFHGKLPVRTVHELAKEIARLEERVPSITLPVLLMFGGADPVVPPSGSAMLARRLTSTKDLKVSSWEVMYHEILNEPERDEVIAELLGWLDAWA
jgi:alpha-beta hydrolase superfamily lysophospholipase